MKTRWLLLHCASVVVVLVTWSTLPHLAQSQVLLHHPTSVATTRASQFQDAFEMFNKNPSQVDSQTPSLVQHSLNLAPSIVITIPVGLLPSGIGINAVTNRIYVANRNSNTVSVIDGTTHQVIATIPVGSRPSLQIGVNPNTNRIYVPNNGGASLSVIDGAAHTVIATITGLAASPEGVGVHPGRNLVYVTHDGDKLSVIDGATNTTSTVINTGYWNHFVAVNPGTDRAYVSKSEPATVAVIDLATNQNITDVVGGGHPAVNPVTNRVYMARYNEPAIGVMDGATNEIIAFINVGSLPGLVAVNPTNNRVYVTLPARNQVAIINGATNTVVNTISVGNRPMGIAVNPVTGLIYVVNENSNTVSVIQGDKDGDGLFDIWETRGLTVTVGNRSVFVNLPAMGANPERKDIFVRWITWWSRAFVCPSLGVISAIVISPSQKLLRGLSRRSLTRLCPILTAAWVSLSMLTTAQTA